MSAPQPPRVLSVSSQRLVVLDGPNGDGWWELSIFKRSAEGQLWEPRTMRLSADEMTALVEGTR